MERLETRHRCCTKQKVKRGLWSPEEDEKLVTFISSYGLSSWSSVPKLAVMFEARTGNTVAYLGLQRCGKSCRLRWINYLRPDLKKGTFTEEEERTIIESHRIIGNRWAQIAKHLPGRTDNEVKNFWNSSIKKKLLSQGRDPTTHNLLPKKVARPKLPIDPSSVCLVGYSGFGWKVLDNDPCFPAPDDTGFRPGVGNSTWVKTFEDQYTQHDDPREGERVEMAVEEAEMERLKRVEMDGHMGFVQGPTSSIGYNYSSDHFEFGDYTAILQGSGVFGDDIVSANGGDQLASSYMNSI